MKTLLLVIAILALFLNSVSAYAETPNELSQKTNINSKKTTNLPQQIDNLVGNYHNQIKIIYSDIDGTILKFDKKNPKTEIPQSVKLTVKKLKDAHIPLILTTGRSYYEASDIAKRMGNDNCYIITQQGAEITDPSGKMIYQDSIKNTDLQKILKEIERFKTINHMTFDVVVFADGKTYSTNKVKLPYNWEEVTVIKSFKKLKNAKACKICISESDSKKLKLIKANLKNKFPEYHVELSAGDYYCDVSSANATKGNAIEKLSKILNVDLKNSATFGDAENDISMFKKTKNNEGLAIAVKNAMDCLKDNANYVTDSVYNDGFAKGIDKILENNNYLQNSKNKR